MELRRRTEAYMRPLPALPNPPVSHTTQKLCEYERLASQRLSLRGIMCVAALLSLVLSLFNVMNHAGNIIIHVLITLVSLGGALCVWYLYHIWATYSGLTNKAARPPSTNVLHSQYSGAFYVEMLIWIIHCPPGVSSRSWLAALDYFIVLRFYVMFLFFTNLTISHHTFSRALSALSGVHLTTSLFLRTCIFAYRVPYCLLGVIASWLMLAALFSKAEGAGFLDSLYFCVTTSAFIGFGDISPVTFGGRFTAGLSWVLGLAIFAWMIGMLREMLRLTEPEQNMYALFRTNELCNTLPVSAAILIQRAWRFHRAVKTCRNSLTRQLAALRLSQSAITFRDERRELKDMEFIFLHSISTFEDYVTRMYGDVGGGASGASTAGHSLTPRGRRRFKHARGKEELTATRSVGVSPSNAARDVSETPDGATLSSGPPTRSVSCALSESTQSILAEPTLEQRVIQLEHTFENLVAVAEKLVSRREVVDATNTTMSISV